MTARLAPLLLLVAAVAGCNRTPPTAPALPTPTIPVSHPVKREVTEYVEYTGRTDAVDSIGIRARATGYLISAPFKEGAEVKKGDLLFEIDPRPYQAQLSQALAQVTLAEAQSRLAKANYERFKATKSGASPAEFDQAKATAEASEAQLESAKATARVYQLNLDYTKVTSPIDGQVGRCYFNVGNLVNQDQTLLTTVVSTDKMHAYLDVDEATDQRITQLVNAGKIPVAGSMPIMMGLAGEEGYPHTGVLDFVNNATNGGTATRSRRGVFDNPKPPNGLRLLNPGQFVRIRLPIGGQRPAVLVVDRAIASDQGLKYVYVVDGQKKVRYRKIKVGPLEDDGLRVVEEGLTTDDMVAVGAIQQLKPGQDVELETVPMPTPGAPQTPPGPAPAPKEGGPDRPKDAKKD